MSVHVPEGEARESEDSGRVKTKNLGVWECFRHQHKQKDRVMRVQRSEV